MVDFISEIVTKLKVQLEDASRKNLKKKKN